MIGAVGLGQRHDPRVRLVVSRGSRPRGEPIPRRGPSRPGPGGAPCPWEPWRPSPRPCRRRSGGARRRRRRRCRRPRTSRSSSRRRAPSSARRSAGPGSRCRRRPARRRGSAARTGRRRTGCRGRVVPGRRYVLMPITSSPSDADALERDLGQRPLAGVVGRAPAPQHVLRVEDQQVLAADREVARRGDRARLVLQAVLDDDRRGLRLEAVAVDRLRRAVDDVRDAVGAADDRRRGRSAARPRPA